MRALLLVMLAAGPAAADAKTKELATGYQKELAACHTRSDGVTKVTTGAQALVDAGENQYADDLEQLHTGLATIQAYCGELEATLQLLADPNASYKALERQLDEHDNKIRKLRQSSKQTVETLAPVMTKLIPAINERGARVEPSVKKPTPLKFPSGRTVDAPPLPGTWKVSGNASSDTAEYAEGKAAAKISVRAVDGTCAERKKDLPRAAVDATGVKLDWYVAYDKDTRRIHTGCRAAKTGSVIATIDDPIADKWPSLEPLLIAMLAVRE